MPHLQTKKVDFALRHQNSLKFKDNLVFIESLMFKAYFGFNKDVKGKPELAKELKRLQASIHEVVVNTSEQFLKLIQSAEDEIDKDDFDQSFSDNDLLVTNIEYIAPAFGRFLGMYSRYDKLNTLYDFMWFEEEISIEEKNIKVKKIDFIFKRAIADIFKSYRKFKVLKDKELNVRRFKS